MGNRLLFQAFQGDGMLRRLARNVTGVTLLPVLSALLLLGACSDSASGPGEGTATLDVLLTDAPGDVDEFWVQILEAYLQGETGRVEILPFDDTRPLVELTSLAGASMPLASGVVLDPTTVSQLRVVIGQAAIVTMDGEIYSKDGGLPPGASPGDESGTLRCPSCGSSGYKINLPDGAITVDPGPNEVVVDFDASQTLAHGAGGSGGWIMHPVLNGMDTDQTGSVQAKIALAPGLVVPDCPPGEPRSLSDFRITAVARILDNGSGEPLRLIGRSDADGDLTIVWVPPDLWDVDGEELTFDKHRLAFSLRGPTSLLVTEGDMTQVDLVIDAATCTGL
jgi:hypothetical protein